MQGLTFCSNAIKNALLPQPANSPRHWRLTLTPLFALGNRTQLKYLTQNSLNIYKQLNSLLLSTAPLFIRTPLEHLFGPGLVN